jgi:hypothetical protein
MNSSHTPNQIKSIFGSNNLCKQSLSDQQNSNSNNYQQKRNQLINNTNNKNRNFGRKNENHTNASIDGSSSISTSTQTSGSYLLNNDIKKYQLIDLFFDAFRDFRDFLKDRDFFNEVDLNTSMNLKHYLQTYVL